MVNRNWQPKEKRVLGGGNNQGKGPGASSVLQSDSYGQIREQGGGEWEDMGIAID